MKNGIFIATIMIFGILGQACEILDRGESLTPEQLLEARNKCVSKGLDIRVVYGVNSIGDKVPIRVNCDL